MPTETNAKTHSGPSSCDCPPSEGACENFYQFREKKKETKHIKNIKKNKRENGSNLKTYIEKNRAEDDGAS